jgi:hypothetical protein
MSADNIIYVKRSKNAWKVWHQSASTKPRANKDCKVYKKFDKAMDSAIKLEEKVGYVEYGITILDGLL